MDLLLEAAGLRSEGGNQGEETKSSCIREMSNIDTKRCEKGTDEEEDCEVSDLSSEEEYEPQTTSIRKRRLTDDGGDQAIPCSKKQSCIQHNENERKRRKSMKYAVHSLREQLTRKTRKAAVNTVLLAAYDEIQDLKHDESEKEGILEELKRKNIVLKYLLEKEINELKQQQSPVRAITCSGSASSDTSGDHPPPPQIYLPSSYRPAGHAHEPRATNHGAISWQWQHTISSRSSPPPVSPLPPPPPLISTKMIPSPSYVSSPPPRILPPPPSLAAQSLSPPRILPPPPSIPLAQSSPPPGSSATRFITYPISPVPERQSNHYSPVICSPSASFFPFTVPIPSPPQIYYPAAPNAYRMIHLTTSAGGAGLPVLSSTKHHHASSEFLYNVATPTTIQPIPLQKEVELYEQKAIELKSPLQLSSRYVCKPESRESLGLKNEQFIHSVATDPHRLAQKQVIKQIPNPSLSIPSSRRKRHSSVITDNRNPSTTNSP